MSNTKNALLVLDQAAALGARILQLLALVSNATTAGRDVSDAELDKCASDDDRARDDLTAKIAAARAQPPAPGA